MAIDNFTLVEVLSKIGRRCVSFDCNLTDLHPLFDNTYVRGTKPSAVDNSKKLLLSKARLITQKQGDDFDGSPELETANTVRKRDIGFVFNWGPTK